MTTQIIVAVFSMSYASKMSEEMKTQIQDYFKCCWDTDCTLSNGTQGGGQCSSRLPIVYISLFCVAAVEFLAFILSLFMCGTKNSYSSSEPYL
jgi:hypothetical protein